MTVSKPSSKPFSEPPAYVEQLVERCTENALRQAPLRQQHRRLQLRRLQLRRRFMAAAASIVIIVGVGITLPTLRQQLLPTAQTAATQADANALENYLASISDEEAQLLTDYEVEEFVEY